jgi:hypothetical protein
VWPVVKEFCANDVAPGILRVVLQAAVGGPAFRCVFISLKSSFYCLHFFHIERNTAGTTRELAATSVRSRGLSYRYGDVYRGSVNYGGLSPKIWFH